MANLVKYIGNLGKSVGYSAVDKFKEVAPTTTEFVTNNQELFKTVYNSVRDYKVTFKRANENIQKSSVYEAADAYKTALFQDIKSGKFYNKERQEEYDAKALGMSSSNEDWSDFDMGGFDDASFDIGGDEDFGSFSEGDAMVTDAVQRSSKSNADAVSMAIARTGEYVVENQKAQTNLLFTQNIQGFHNISNGLGAINDNIGKILDFSSGVIQTHAENSQKYYDTMTKMMQEQLAAITRIANEIAPEKKEEKKKEKITFEDIVGANGAPNLSMYFKQVKKNAGNAMSEFMPNMDFGGGGNVLLSMVAQPLKIIPDLIVNKLVPDMVEKSISEFDKSVSGLFGASMAKMNKMKNSDNPLYQYIGRIFGISNGAKSDIDTSNYIKDKVNWDGKSKKALEYVIPTHLARIESLLSGKSERRFDYDRGKFVDGKAIKESYNNLKDSFINKSASDMMDEMKKYTDLMSFNNLEDKEEMDKDFFKIFKYLYQNNEIFDLQSKDLYDLARKYGVDSKNLAIFRTLFKKAPKSVQNGLNSSIMSNRQKQNETFAQLEESGSIYANLFDGLKIDEFIKTNKKTGEQSSLGLFGQNNLLNTLDNKGHNLYYYLQNINKELIYMRRTGLRGGSINSDIIDSNGRVISFNTNFDDIEIQDESKKSKSRLYNEDRERQNKTFKNKEDRRREKNPNLINYDNFEFGNEGEKDLANSLGSAIETRRTSEMLKANREKQLNKKPDLIEELLDADDLVKKYQIMKKKGSNILKKPMDFISNVFRKADQRIYEMIYGTSENNGFMGLLVDNTKKTFKRLNDWIDEEVLEPLKQKLNIDSFRDLGKKFFGMFGIDFKDIKEGIHETLFGKDSFMSNVKEGMKESFSNAWKTVKTSVTGTWNDITNPFREKFKNKKRAFKEASEKEDDSYDYYENTGFTIPKEKEYDLTVQNNINRATGVKQQKGFFEKQADRFSTEMGFRSYRDLIKENNSKLNSYTSHKNNISKAIENMKKSGASEDDLAELYTQLGDVDGFLKLYTDRQKELGEKENSIFNNPDTKEYKYISLLQKLGLGKDKNVAYDLMDNLGDFDYGKKISDIIGYLKQDKKLSPKGGKVYYKNQDSINRIKMFMNDNKLDSDMTLEELFSGKTKEDSSKKASEYNELFKLANTQEESTNYLKDIRDLLYEVKSNALNTMKNKVGTSGYNVFNSTKAPLVPGIDPGEGQAMWDKSRGLANVIFKFFTDNLEHHKEGTAPIKENQVASLRKGEMVLTPEQAKSFVNFINAVTGKMSDAKNKLANSDIASKVYGKFSRLKGKLGDFNPKDIDNLSEDDKELLKESGLDFSKLQDIVKVRYEKIVDMLEKQFSYDNELDENGEPKDPIQKALYKNLKPFTIQMAEEAQKGFNSVKKSLFGDTKSDNEAFTKAVEDVSSNISEYAPKMLPASLIGGGVSLLTGAIGGPILGAAIGAGTSLAINSDKVKDWLFGDEIDGERKGGVVSKDFQDNIKKYIPDATKYGITGALTGLVMPYGMVGGLLLGSGASFVKNNQSAQDFLFGEEGLFKPEAREKLKKALPRMGLGVLAGVTMGPFGLVGNAMLGAGAGYLTTSNKFRDTLLGVYNEHTGKYEDGILPALREQFVDPLRNFGSDIKEKFFEFMETKIFDPLKDFLDPLKTMGHNAINTLGRWTGNALDFFFERTFGVPFRKLAHDLTSKVSGWAKKIGGGLIKGAGKIISAPFAALGGIGRRMTRKQIENGSKYNMTAAERLEFMNSKKGRGLIDILTGTTSESKYGKLDQFLAESDFDELTQLETAFRGINDLKKSEKDKRKEIANKTVEQLAPHTTKSQLSKIMKMYRDGADLSSIQSVTNKAGTQKKAIYDKIVQNAQSYFKDEAQAIYRNAEKKGLTDKEVNRQFIHLKDRVKKKFLSELDSNTQKEILDSLMQTVDKNGVNNEGLNKYNSLLQGKLNGLSKDKGNIDSILKNSFGEFENYKNNKANADTVRSNLNKLVKQYGLNIDVNNQKDLDQVWAMIQTEVKRAKGEKNLSNISEETKDQFEENDAKVLNSIEEENKKRHKDIITLFTEAVNGIRLLNGQKPLARNAAENVVKSVKPITVKKKEESTKTDFVNGKVIQYKKEKNGDWSPNLSDSGTKQALAESAEEGEQKKSLFSKLTGLFTKKDKGTGSGKQEENKGGGILSSIFGAISGGASMLPTSLKIVGGIMGIGLLSKVLKNSGIGEYITKNVIPAASDTFVEVIKKATPALVDLFAQGVSAVLPALLSGVASLGKGLVTNFVFPEFFGNSDESPLSNGIVRGVLKGDVKGFANIAEKTAMKGSTLEKVGKFAKHPFFNTGKKAINLTAKAGEKAAAGVTKITSKIDDLPVLKNLRNTIEKKSLSTLDPIMEKVGKSADKGIIGSALRAFQQGLEKLLMSDTFVKIVGNERAYKILNKFMPAMVTTVSEQAMKQSAKVSAKLAAVGTTFGIAEIAFAISDFVSGYNDAALIFGVSEDDEFKLGLGYKVMAGLIKAINGLFIVTSFIPEKLYIKVFYDYLLPIFGIKNGKMQQQREKTEQEVAEYNKKNGTNYNTEEYLKNVKGHKSIWKKAIDAVKINKEDSVGVKFLKGGFLGAAKDIKDIAKNQGIALGKNLKIGINKGKEWLNPLINAASGAKDRLTDRFKTGINNIGNSIKDKYEEYKLKYIENLIKPISTGVKFISNIFVKYSTMMKDFFKNGINKFKEIFINPIKERFDNVKNWAKEHMEPITNWIKEKFEIGKNVVNNVKNSVNNLKDKVTSIPSNIKNGVKEKINGIGTYLSGARDKTINWLNNIGGSYEESNNFSKQRKDFGLDDYSDMKYTGMGGELVTEDQLNSLGWKNASGTINDLNDALTNYHIDSQSRITNFLAQCAHESGWGKYTKELADGTAYEGRTDLGNTQPGDGKKYKGGGYIQVTGRSNYQSFADAIGDPKVMDGVDYVAQNYPWSSAGYWWQKNGMNKMADNGATVQEISKRVNGGTNGLADRVAAFAKINNVLQGLPAEGSVDDGVGNQKTSGSDSDSSDGGNILTDGLALISNAINRFFGNDSSSSSSNGNSSSSGSGVLGQGDVAKVLAKARSRVGCPYVWAGNGEPLTRETVEKYKNTDHNIASNPNWEEWLGKPGFDCSGLVIDAMKAGGIDLSAYRTTQAMCKQGENVKSLSEAQPGDLLFFGDYSSPHHVAIYSGNNMMIEAPSSGKAVQEIPIKDHGSNPSRIQRVIKNTSTATTTDTTTSSINQLNNEKLSMKHMGGEFEKKVSQGKDKRKKLSSPLYTGQGGLADKYFTNTLNGNVTSGYGYRGYATGKIPKNHTGIDIGAKQGKDIESPIGGTVIAKKDPSKSNGLGNMIALKDKFGGEHYFGHMENASTLNPGDKVKAGDKIGKVGNTGNSTGPHLHYETRVAGKDVDPNAYLQSTKGKRRKNIGGETNSDTNTLLQTVVKLLENISNNTLKLETIIELIKVIKGDNTSSTTKNQAKAEDDSRKAVGNVAKALQNNKPSGMSNDDLMAILTAISK